MSELFPPAEAGAAPSPRGRAMADEILEPGPVVAAPAEPSALHRGLEALKDNIEAFTIALIMALVIKHFCVEAFKIPTGSMYPTLYGESNSSAGVGDRILVDKWAYLWHDPQRWDVVVFRYPLNQSKHFIKRLVGKSGEWINVVRGDIWVKEGADATWHIATKRRHARDELYLPVYPPEEPDSSQAWRRQGLLPPDQWWDSEAGWSVGAYDRLTFEGGGAATTRLKKRIGKGSDPLSYGFDSDRTLVYDVRVRLRARPAGPGRLRLRWTSRKDETAALALATADLGPSALRTQSRGEAREEAIAAHLTAGTWTEVELECVDGQVYVHVGGTEVRHVDLGLRLEDVRDIEDFVQELAFEAEGAALEIADLRIDRDLYYTGDGMAEFGAEGKGIEIPTGHYFMMGDNTEHSSDSRKWTLDGVRLEDGTEIWYESSDPENRPRYDRSGWQSVVDQDGIERRWRREDESSESRTLHRRAPFVSRDLVVGRAFFVFWPIFPDPPGRAGFIH